MRRLLAVLAVSAWVGGASADVPPPKGFKRVAVDHKITTEKDYPDYAFFTVVGRNVSPVKLDTKTPIEILAKNHRGPRFSGTKLAAVPKDAAKNYASEKDFFAAIAAGKVEGEVQAKSEFYALGEAKDTEKRDTILHEYKLEKIDPKAGIVLAPQGGTTAPKGEGGKDSPEDDSDSPHNSTARTPHGGMWVAGVAAALAVMLGGFWLAGRARRKA